MVALALALSAPAGAQSVERWNNHIDEAAARFGIPPGWIRRVMEAESGGRTMLDGTPISSRAGAMGLMQLMPGTWRDMRRALGLGADPHNPRDNILAGTAYLRLMYDRFGHPGLFAAYNAGPARYAAFLSGRRNLPAETRAYVANVARVDARSTVAGAEARRQAPFTIFALAAGAKPAKPAAAPLRPGSTGLFVALGDSPGQ